MKFYYFNLYFYINLFPQIVRTRIDIVKRKINMTDELRSKIKWACTFNNCVPMIKNGSLKIIEHTNLAYVEPHRVIIKEKLFLFFNNHEYFYIDNLQNKYPISKLQDMVN